MQILKWNKNKKGFGLVELVMAMLILSIALVGLLNLMAYLVRASQVNKEMIIALNLAREGVEVIRNVRDGNWLNACPTWGGSCSHWTTAGGTRTCCQWDSGLNSGGDHTLTLDFDTANNWYVLNYTPNDFTSAGTLLYLDSVTELYVTSPYMTGGSPASKYRRLITVDFICRNADESNEQVITAGDCGAQKKVGIQVTSTVQWNDGDNDLSLVDKLYNWK
ncbi:MAG TPA: prepilin-type N-terminal cleavage/methylation domain-containing protein [bacterium]|nr:prepilin-type N-terminal cleavage/methylation domain-containing protein [bacterium]